MQIAMSSRRRLVGRRPLTPSARVPVAPQVGPARSIAVNLRGDDMKRGLAFLFCIVFTAVLLTCCVYS